MSGWDAYIKALLGDGKVMTGAAIYGQGATPALWASSSASYVGGPEVLALSQGLTMQPKFDEMSGTGFKVGGTKYMMLHSEQGKIIRGKAGEFATAAALSKKAIIIATGKGTPQEVSACVEKMAADLSSKGF